MVFFLLILKQFIALTRIGVVLGSWSSDIKIYLSAAALRGQTTKMALTEEFMFQNVAYWPTVYITGRATYNFLNSK